MTNPLRDVQRLELADALILASESSDFVSLSSSTPFFVARMQGAGYTRERVRLHVANRPPDAVSLISLETIAMGDAPSLVMAIRNGLCDGREASQGARRPPPLVAFTTKVRMSDIERSFTHAFMMAWELIDLRGEMPLLPVPLLAGNQGLMLGSHPKALAGDMIHVLWHKRIMTYRDLTTNERPSLKEAKRLGKVLTEYSKHGLVRARGFATTDQLYALGITELPQSSRPQLWESVPAAVWKALRGGSSGAKPVSNAPVEPAEEGSRTAR